MAKNKNIQKLEKLTTKQILEMDWKDIQKLNKQELKQVVQTLNRTSKARINRIKKAGISSPAVEELERKDFIFSVRNKTINELRSSLSQTRKFLLAQTSTLKGARAFENEMREKTRMAWKKFDEEKKKEFFRIVDKLTEIDPAFAQEHYKEIWGLVGELMMDENVKDEDVFEIAQNKLEKLYEKKKLGSVLSDEDWLFKSNEKRIFN